MICSNKECAKEFEPKTHNQKYCTDECCRIATNRRIMEKYYEKKAIRNGARRGCKLCDVQLSRYNESNLCASCTRKVNQDQKTKLLGMINEIS
jgi:hypothetical protein